MRRRVKFLLTQTQPVFSSLLLSFQGHGLPLQEFTLEDMISAGSLRCADFSLRRCRQLGLGPYGMGGRRATHCSSSASPNLRWPEIDTFSSGTVVMKYITE